MFILLSFKEIIDKRTELSLSEWKPQVVFGESLLVKEKKNILAGEKLQYLLFLNLEASVICLKA